MSYGDVFLDGVIRMSNYNNAMIHQRIFGQRLMEMYHKRDRIKKEKEIEAAKQEEVSPEWNFHYAVIKEK